MPGTIRLSVVWFLALSLISCGGSSDPTLNSVVVSPAQVMLYNVGEGAQLKAMANYTSTSYSQTRTTREVTSQVTWESVNPAVATVSASGVVTAAGQGTTTVTATLNGSTGPTAGTATVVVASSGSGGGGTGELTSITIIPGEQTVLHTGETSQYIAIGNYAEAPVSRDITNLVTWSSSDIMVATIDAGGLATGVNPGETTIVALMTSPVGGHVISGTATFEQKLPADGEVNLPTLTVYKVGPGTGTVVSTPAPINCGTGAACTGHFTLNSTVTLTATADAGSEFGGWSANCVPVPADRTKCTIMMNNNDTVGAIFNSVAP